MTATEIMSRLTASGIQLQADGERLRFYPAEKVDEALRREMRQQKAQLLALLKSGEKQPQSAVQRLQDSCSELQAVTTMLSCPECGSRLHQLTHPLDETDHYLACESCDYRAMTPTVLRDFCYGDDCNEELTYINGQAYCKRHQMTITIIGLLQ